MSTRRRLTALLLAATVGASGSTAQACWLTNCLYGRTPSTYAAGYAPVGLPVSTTPVLTTTNGVAPYAANFASPYTASPYSTPLLTNGAYQAQRPAYLDNPSVYTGMPVSTANAQASFSVPVTAGFRGTPPAGGGSYYGASNAYPSGGMPLNSNLPYYAAYSTSAGNALPATQVAPLFPPTPPQPQGGLARFFGSLFGTNYQTSYYRAPVTYYRPVTSVDPMSGTTVTVQQPCTSTLTQVQRTPFTSFQSGAAGQPMASPQSCQTATPYGGFQGQPGYAAPGINGFANNGFANNGLSNNGFANNGVGQVGAIGASPNQFTVPIPSTAPPSGSGGFYGPPNSAGGSFGNPAPLTGSPTNPQAQVGAADRAPMDDPQMQSLRPMNQPFAPESQTMPPTGTVTPPPNSGSSSKSYWQLQDADNSTAMIRSQSGRQTIALPPPVTPPTGLGNSTGSGNPASPWDTTSPFATPTDPTSLTPPSFTAAQPIRALDDDPSPFQLRDQLATPANNPAARPSDAIPSLPPASPYGPADASNASSRPSSYAVPAREAGLVRPAQSQMNPSQMNPSQMNPSQVVRPKPTPLTPQRDNTWTVIGR